jgi:hypothetical protein
LDAGDVGGRIVGSAGNDQRAVVLHVLVVQRALARLRADGGAVGVDRQGARGCLLNRADVGGRLAQDHFAACDGGTVVRGEQRAHHDRLIFDFDFVVQGCDVCRCQRLTPHAKLVDLAVEGFRGHVAADVGGAQTAVAAGRDVAGDFHAVPVKDTLVGGHVVSADPVVPVQVRVRGGAVERIAHLGEGAGEDVG